MDRVDKETRSRIMSRIRSKSSIEVLPERLKGLHLHRHPRGIFGNPDFGNKARRIVVFIDGCFWHRCPIHYREPQSNREYWIPKIERNEQRDREVTETLVRAGWQVHRVWEHEILDRKT